MLFRTRATGVVFVATVVARLSPGVAITITSDVAGATVAVLATSVGVTREIGAAGSVASGAIAPNDKCSVLPGSNRTAVAVMLGTRCAQFVVAHGVAGAVAIALNHSCAGLLL